MGDDVMSAAYSADAKYVCVAMLDASIKVLASDSLGLFLTLYGHQLPVLSVSASSSGDLLVSGSADKCIKIWGLDFGDCHRSLYGHTEAVMSVAFVRDTHYFFSASKDKTVRYWDADKFEQILLLRGHHAEVWGVVPSRSGALLVSLSRDRSIRLWRRSDEQVFLEEEREAELEHAFEQGLERRQHATEAEEEEAATLGLDGGPAESGTAGRRTIESVKGAERVLEALKVRSTPTVGPSPFRRSLASPVRPSLGLTLRTRPWPHPLHLPSPCRCSRRRRSAGRSLRAPSRRGKRATATWPRARSGPPPRRSCRTCCCSGSMRAATFSRP